MSCLHPLDSNWQNNQNGHWKILEKCQALWRTTREILRLKSGYTFGWTYDLSFFLKEAIEGVKC